MKQPLAWLLALAAGMAGAAEPSCPRGDDWSAACFEKVGGERRVKARYLPRLARQPSGMAVVVIDDPREMVAVDRRGVVRVPGIYHAGDFD